MPVSRKPDDKLPGGESGGGAPAPAAKPKRVVTHRTLALKESSQLPSKRTLNLCMREKTGMPVEMFLLILSIILIVVILVEFFGIYRPYLTVEALEAELTSQQQALAEKTRKREEMDKKYLDKYNMTLTEYFNQYNFEGFDLTLADRLDILDLLEREILSKIASARIGEISVRGNEVNVIVYDIEYAGVDLNQLTVNLKADKMVSSSYTNNISKNEDGTSTTRITIVLKDATTVEEEA